MFSMFSILLIATHLISTTIQEDDVCLVLSVKCEFNNRRPENSAPVLNRGFEFKANTKHGEYIADVKDNTYINADTTLQLNVLCKHLRLNNDWAGPRHTQQRIEQFIRYNITDSSLTLRNNNQINGKLIYIASANIIKQNRNKYQAYSLSKQDSSPCRGRYTLCWGDNRAKLVDYELRDDESANRYATIKSESAKMLGIFRRNNIKNVKVHDAQIPNYYIRLEVDAPRAFKQAQMKVEFVYDDMSTSESYCLTGRREKQLTVGQTDWMPMQIMDTIKTIKDVRIVYKDNDFYEGTNIYRAETMDLREKLSGNNRNGKVKHCEWGRSTNRETDIELTTYSHKKVYLPRKTNEISSEAFDTASRCFVIEPRNKNSKRPEAEHNQISSRLNRDRQRMTAKETSRTNNAFYYEIDRSIDISQRPRYDRLSFGRGSAMNGTVFLKVGPRNDRFLVRKDGQLTHIKYFIKIDSNKPMCNDGEATSATASLTGLLGECKDVKLQRFDEFKSFHGVHFISKGNMFDQCNMADVGKVTGIVVKIGRMANCYRDDYQITKLTVYRPDVDYSRSTTSSASTSPLIYRVFRFTGARGLSSRKSCGSNLEFVFPIYYRRYDVDSAVIDDLISGKIRQEVESYSSQSMQRRGYDSNQYSYESGKSSSGHRSSQHRESSSRHRASKHRESSSGHRSSQHRESLSGHRSSQHRESSSGHRSSQYEQSSSGQGSSQYGQSSSDQGSSQYGQSSSGQGSSQYGQSSSGQGSSQYGQSSSDQGSSQYGQSSYKQESLQYDSSMQSSSSDGSFRQSDFTTYEARDNTRYYKCFHVLLSGKAKTFITGTRIHIYLMNRNGDRIAATIPDQSDEKPFVSGVNDWFSIYCPSSKRSHYNSFKITDAAMFIDQDFVVDRYIIYFIDITEAEGAGFVRFANTRTPESGIVEKGREVRIASNSYWYYEMKGASMRYRQRTNDKNCLTLSLFGRRIRGHYDTPDGNMHIYMKFENTEDGLMYEGYADNVGSKLETNIQTTYNIPCRMMMASGNRALSATKMFRFGRHISLTFMKNEATERTSWVVSTIMLKNLMTGVFVRFGTSPYQINLNDNKPQETIENRNSRDVSYRIETQSGDANKEIVGIHLNRNKLDKKSLIRTHRSYRDDAAGQNSRFQSSQYDVYTDELYGTETGRLVGHRNLAKNLAVECNNCPGRTGSHMNALVTTGDPRQINSEKSYNVSFTYLKKNKETNSNIYTAKSATNIRSSSYGGMEDKLDNQILNKCSCCKGRNSVFSYKTKRTRTKRDGNGKEEVEEKVVKRSEYEAIGKLVNEEANKIVNEQ